MSNDTAAPYFPDNLNEYAPWVAKHGLRAPYGECQCGCGEDGPRATEGRKRLGFLMNHPKRFIHGHNAHTGTIEQRFWRYVDRRGPNECWEWRAARDRHGYGRLMVHSASEHTPVLAHRLSWTIHNGPIAGDMCVLHNCPDGDNPACVNPAHLWLGSKADNVADMDAKGRRVNSPQVGEMHPCAKLTAANVREIRERYARGEGRVILAAEYGVNKLHINGIVRRGTWKHVE